MLDDLEVEEAAAVRQSDREPGHPEFAAAGCGQLHGDGVEDLVALGDERVAEEVAVIPSLGQTLPEVEMDQAA